MALMARLHACLASMACEQASCVSEQLNSLRNLRKRISQEGFESCPVNVENPTTKRGGRGGGGDRVAMSGHVLALVSRISVSKDLPGSMAWPDPTWPDLT
eukprot:365025-Chlamydomonas_euryale.AAC.19